MATRAAPAIQGTNGQTAVGVAQDFASGFIGGPDARDGGTLARQVGDLCGALVPGLGEIKAVQDLWQGTKSGDSARIVAGIVGLIPVVGAAGKAGSAAAKKVAAEATEKGIKQTSLRLGEAMMRSAKTAAQRPEVRKKAAEALDRTAQDALTRIVDGVMHMQEKGETPEVHTRKHSSFVDARAAAEQGISERPNQTWRDLRMGDDDSKTVVGRHHPDGSKGFRIMTPQGSEAKEADPLRLYWWNERKPGDLAFGIEECPASEKEVARILEAYLNRKKSFRVKKSA